MLYSKKNGPKEVYLAPKDFAGYVLLVNSATSETFNCKTVKAVIDSALRVILYTSRVVAAEEELLYDYGPAYKFSWRDDHL